MSLGCVVVAGVEPGMLNSRNSISEVRLVQVYVDLRDVIIQVGDVSLCELCILPSIIASREYV